MLQAERSSAAVKSDANVALQAAAADHGWRESILVLVVVLAPIGLAAIAVAIGSRRPSGLANRARGVP
jgi:hypothetical protein